MSRSAHAAGRGRGPSLGLGRGPGLVSRGLVSLALVSRGLVSLALVSLALAGCLAQNTSGTQSPDGPSEDGEVNLADLSNVPGSGMTDAEAEQAAKVAAAQKVLEKVNDRDPEEEKKKMAKSRTISAQARAKLDQRANAEAVSIARDALKVHEQNVDAMLVIAEVYYREGKYELTRAVASSALQVDAKTRTPEDSSRAYNLQGFAMLAMGEDNAATQSFKKAAEADDKNAAAWNNLGTRYLDAGDIATATSCFEYALELDPRFVKAHLNYGASLRAERKWEAAEAALLEALKLRPNYPEAYFNLGVLYLDADPFPGLDTTQRLNKAIQNLARFRELAPASGSKSASDPKGLGVEGSAKAPPPRVSKERADDYIRVANKGIEREARRLEREKGREAGPGDDAADAGDPGGDPSVADDAGDDEAGVADDGAPTPQGPAAGGDTEAPAPQGPAAGGDAEPSQPAPAKPEPAKPAPQGPATPAPQEPSTPAPVQPAPQGPSTPAPVQPAPEPTQPEPTQPAPTQPAPTQPAPTQPAPTQPAPVQPAPQGPAKPAPTQPAPTQPQKPSVQKPQSASWSSSPEKDRRNLASRGTRSVPPTLITMEAGAPSSTCVDLVLSPRGAARCTPRPARVHGHRSLASSDLDDPVVAWSRPRRIG